MLAEELNAPDETGLAPLHAAADAGQPTSCELLLLAGAALEPHTPAERTPVHLAAASGSERCLEILLRRGASPDVVRSQPLSPLAPTPPSTVPLHRLPPPSPSTVPR